MSVNQTFIAALLFIFINAWAFEVGAKVEGIPQILFLSGVGFVMCMYNPMKKIFKRG